jgi:uncharacterized protein YehS (DUF1456 family)
MYLVASGYTVGLEVGSWEARIIKLLKVALAVFEAEVVAVFEAEVVAVFEAEVVAVFEAEVVAV